MQPTQATTWITEARFVPYLEEAGGEDEKALTLYVWNARISAAAFEALHHVEVILRNAVDAQFAPLEGSAARIRGVCATTSRECVTLSVSDPESHGDHGISVKAVTAYADDTVTPCDLCLSGWKASGALPSRRRST
jgi:hypothetical protein